MVYLYLEETGNIGSYMSCHFVYTFMKQVRGRLFSKLYNKRFWNKLNKSFD